MTSPPPRASSGRSPRRPTGRLSTLLIAALTVVALAFASGTAVAGPGRREVPGGRTASAGGSVVRVMQPGAGSTVVRHSRVAAERARVRAVVRVHGRVDELTVKLNGHPLPHVAARPGRHVLLLNRARGLRVGTNLLWVSATVRGRRQPAQASRTFVVGYPVSGMMTTDLRLGRGDAPAALASVGAPLAGVHSLTAAVNGGSVIRPGARPERGDHRRFDLNLAHFAPLRFGRNTLRLRLVMNDGRVEDVRRSFTLSKTRAIAVARASGPATVGHRLDLDADALWPSRHDRRRRDASGRGVHWALIDRPARSHTAVHHASARRASLTPDVPGTYRVALRVGSGPTAGYDLIDVDVTDAQTLVPFDTRATVDGRTGLQVGDDFYPSPGGDDSLTVYTLSRYTLGLDGARPVFGDPVSQAGVADVKSYLADLPTTDFAVVTYGGNDLSSGLASDLDDALQEIGGNLGARWSMGPHTDCWTGWSLPCTDYGNPDTTNPKLDSWTKQADDTSSFSIVGVPGMRAGQAWRQTAAQSGDTGGRMVGYFTPGTSPDTQEANTYTVVRGPDPYIPVDTCADVDGHTCAVTVGRGADQQVYPDPKEGGVNGFHVVVLDRTTLRVLENQTVADVAGLQNAINVSNDSLPPRDRSVVHYQTGDQMGDQAIVIVQSTGNGRPTGTPTSYLWQHIDQLGGTPEALDANIYGKKSDGTPAYQTYALVGVADNLPWHGLNGIESSTVMAHGAAPGQPDGHVRAELARDRTGLYTPSSGSLGGPLNDEFFSVLYQPGQPWPYAGDPALAYIADGLGLDDEYADVRSAYTDLGIDWATERQDLSAMTCTDTSRCGDDFADVKSELLDEFKWVTAVRAFITNLRSPYSQQGSGAVFSVQEIYDEIQDSVPPPPPKPSTFDWLKFVGEVVGIGAAIGVPGAADAAKALSVATNTMGVVSGITGLVEGDHGGTAATVHTDEEASALAVQLADQQVAAEAAIGVLETILLTDYGRLRTVGTDAGGGDASWAWQDSTTTTTVDAMNAATRAQAYSTLIPETYAATNLEPGWQGSGEPMVNADTTNDVTKYKCASGHIFAPALDANQFHAVSRTDDGGVTRGDVWTFANIKQGQTHPQMPTASLTDDIYGDDSTGPEGAHQYAPAWWRATYNPPGAIACEDVYLTYVYPAPDIPLPLP